MEIKLKLVMLKVCNQKQNKEKVLMIQFIKLK